MHHSVSFHLQAELTIHPAMNNEEHKYVFSLFHHLIEQRMIPSLSSVFKKYVKEMFYQQIDDLTWNKLNKLWVVISDKIEIV